MCFILHDWGKWEKCKVEYTYVTPITKKEMGKTNEIKQMRTCKICGKIQIRRIGA